MADKISFSKPAEKVYPGNFESEKHFYPKVLNAELHPIVSYFFNLSRERLISRYCHLNPKVDPRALESILSYQCMYIPWAGADLFHVATAEGVRKMVVIETNSSPSGQKSMPLIIETEDQGGYRVLLENIFLPLLKKRGLPKGSVAVIYDKNKMEASGYAATLADILKEPVYLAGFFEGDPDPSVRFRDKILEIRDQDHRWHPIKAAFRYVTQRPWNRVPIQTKTLIFNPITACLAGGRNKMVASKAYDIFNAEIQGTGLKINIPETIMDVRKNEIPLWFKKFGGHAVIKNPYSNAGQGVYIITNERELKEFMEINHRYELFIIQSLIGNYQWSTTGQEGKFYHVGTVPNKKKNIYVADIRMMVGSSRYGFIPIALYARKSNLPLPEKLDKKTASWDILGTNLSIKNKNGSWDSDTRRLLLMDRKDFNTLGISLDQLIEAFIQTVLAVNAIDRMAKTLMTKKGVFRKKLFNSLDYDKTLAEEIIL